MLKSLLKISEHCAFCMFLCQSIGNPPIYIVSIISGMILFSVKNLNFMADMTQHFVSAKRLIRYFSNSRKLVEHRAQSPIREVKMLAVRSSIAEGFLTATSRAICNKKLSSSCEEFKFKFLSAMLNMFAGIRKVSDESLGPDETPHHTTHEI